MKRKRWWARSTAHAPNAASTAWLFLPRAQVFSCREIGAQMQVILYPYRLVEYDDADNFFFNCWELVACQYANEWPEYNGRNRNNACHESQLSAVQFRSKSGIHPEDVDCVIHFVTQFYFTIFYRWEIFPMARRKVWHAESITKKRKKEIVSSQPPSSGQI
jgi:hypothetical protein